jgi:hypothetical protein
MPITHTSSGALIGQGSAISISNRPHQFFERAGGLMIGLKALAPLDPRHSQAAVFLASWCVELTLKGFLDSKGQTKKMLQPIRHNLAALWNKSSELGLAISKSAPAWCVLLSETHNAPFHQRYPTDAASSVAPNLELLVREIERLHALAAQSLR